MDPPTKIPDPANGSRHHHHQQQQQRKKKNKKGSGGSHRQRAKKYRECLRNHAASLGTHALDGCSEFIASASSDHADPVSLTCAACTCHRNFHRLDSSPSSSSPSPSPPSSSSDDEAGSHVLLTLKTAAAPPPETPAGEGGGRRKRFRSSFSREQKEGMMELAERIGWRLQRRDDEAIEESCRRIGVERGVFKVWMHNNKQAVTAMKRKKKKKNNDEASNDDDDDDGSE